MQRLVGMLRATGDSTRLRLLLLLVVAELTVSELTQILGQSQPRVSRHLKLLCDAGLLERFKEGAWVFYRAADRGDAGTLARTLGALAEQADAAILADDRRRLAQVRASRAEEAAAYFKANAPQWERIRSLHVPERDVEKSIVKLLGHEKFDSLLDAGTGTGRILELLAPHIGRGLGIDVAPDVGFAREKRNANALHCQVRRGDIIACPLPMVRDAGFDAVIFHQCCIIWTIRKPRSAKPFAWPSRRPHTDRRFRAARVEFLRESTRTATSDFRPRSAVLVQGRGSPLALNRWHRAPAPRR
jgi:DNA-binding transcriptional ArsR family regulator